MEEHQVRLEFVASVKVDAHRALRFVRGLHAIAADAWCEVRSVSSQPERAGAREAVVTTVLLSCERSIADLLCQRFAIQTRLVSQGEILLVRCCRTLLRLLATAASGLRNAPNHDDEVHLESTTRAIGVDERNRPAALPRSTMVDLLDCIGDRIADVFDAFQTSALPCENGKIGLTIVGVSHALRSLELQGTNSRLTAMAARSEESKKGSCSNQREPSVTSDVQLTRNLLTQLVAHGAIALSTLPERNDTPFLVYTDFVSCYVAHLSRARSASRQPAVGPSPNETQSIKKTMSISCETQENDRNRNQAKTHQKSKRCRLLSCTNMFFGVADLADCEASQRPEHDDGRSSRNSGRSRKSRLARQGYRASSRHESLPDNMPAHALLADGEALFLRENTTLARQALTSSASRVRPGKQQAVQPRSLHPHANQLPDHLCDRCPVRCCDNNSEGCDDPVLEESTRVGIRGAFSNQFSRNRGEWEIVHGITPEGQLPARSRSYLNHCNTTRLADCSPGSCTSGPLVNKSITDRPPSRQRHAFPTHLLDAREFCSPTKNHENVSITPWHAEIEESGDAEQTHPDDDLPRDRVVYLNNGRPPSRYMVKASRGGNSSSPASSPSQNAESCSFRRGAPGSWSQVAIRHHHDPKRDGFLEVDESVPPPFKVEISTEPYNQRSTASHTKNVHERQHRQSARITGNQSGISRYEYRNPISTHRSEILPEPDSQEVISMARGVDVDSGIRLIVNTRTSNKAEQEASLSNGKSGYERNSSDQWFHSSDNPFFVFHGAVATTFDDMDSDAAIASTPLFTEENCLTRMAQLSDLHLDDFMGESYTTNAPMLVSKTSTSTNTINGKVSSRLGSLNTSLGRDFLSLFAQN